MSESSEVAQVQVLRAWSERTYAEAREACDAFVADPPKDLSRAAYDQRVIELLDRAEQVRAVDVQIEAADKAAANDNHADLVSAIVEARRIIKESGLPGSNEVIDRLDQLATQVGEIKKDVDAVRQEQTRLEKLMQDGQRYLSHRIDTIERQQMAQPDAPASSPDDAADNAVTRVIRKMSDHLKGRAKPPHSNEAAPQKTADHEGK